MLGEYDQGGPVTRIVAGIADASPPSPEPVNMVNHPPHYNHHPSGIEAIDVARHMTFDAGNSFTYIYRCDAKNGRQDIEKALWYWKDVHTNEDLIWIPGNRLYLGRAALSIIIGYELDRHKQMFYKCMMPSLRHRGTAILSRMLELSQ